MMEDDDNKSGRTEEEAGKTTDDKKEARGVEKEDEDKEEEPEIKIEAEVEEDDINIPIPPKRQEILKAYPDLFKKFPALEKAYYRDQSYSEILPTVEDAKEAAQKADEFDKLQSKMMEGDITDVLKSVKENNEDAFRHLVDNYLPILHQTDPAAHFNILSNVFKNAVANMMHEGQRLKNEDLQNAAVILNQFMFGASDYQPPRPYGKGEATEAEQRLQAREQQLVQKQFERNSEELNHRVDNILKSTISEHIDPRESMTPYTRKQAVRDALETTQELLEQDTKFRASLDSLWRKAFESDFSKKSLDAIKSAYISKARTILPDVIKKTRAEALKEGNRAPSSGKEKYEPPASHGRTTTSPRADSRNTESTGKKVSTLDFLMQD